MRITIIGLGYVGSVAAAALSKSGHRVTAVDIDHAKILSFRQGILPIKEPGLSEIIQESIRKDNLEFRSIYNINDITDSVIMICVGTPSKTNGEVNLDQVYAVINWIISHATKAVTIIMKSTVPPGTGESLISEYLTNSKIKHSYIMNPEFLREGQAIADWFNPDRIVIGGEDQTAINITCNLYKDINAPLVITDLTTAELIKYAANAFLATKISFINEIAKLCEQMGSNIEQVSRGIGLDKRIGSSFLKAGLGYGGSCFPKDTRALDTIFSKYNLDFTLLKAVINVNNHQRQLAVTKLKAAIGSLENKRIAVLGLAFKPGTDDIREAPSLDIIRLLCKEGAIVHAHDPEAIKNAQKELPTNVVYFDTAIKALDGVCGLVVATEWEEFNKLDWQLIKEKMEEPFVIIDGRNCLSFPILTQYGFRYIGFGYGSK